MGLINFGNKTAKNYPDKDDKKNYKKSNTLEPIKNSVKSDGGDYYRVVNFNKNEFTLKQRKNYATFLNSKGDSEFYESVSLFYNTIDNMVDTLTDEVFSDLEFQKFTTDEKIEQISQVDFQKIRLTLQLDVKLFKQIFKTLYLYDECFIVVDNIEGYANFTIYLPFQYIKKEETVYIIDLKNETLIQTEGHILSSNYNFHAKLETILAYDLSSTALPIETKINQSKIFVDKKMFQKNPIYDETIQLIDVPKSIAVDSTNNKSKYIDVFAGKNTLPDLISSKREAELNMVNIFKLSKKTLGIDSGGQDFASSLPYENDMTAKTINNLRDDLSTLFQSFIFKLTNLKIVVDFGKYQLDSLEAIVDVNDKMYKSNQISILEQVARRLDLPSDSFEVQSETLRIKIEKNITLTYDEDLKAQELQLLPPASNSFIESEPVELEGNDDTIL